MSKTVLQIRSNGQITLPAAIRRKAKLSEGDLLDISIEEDGSTRLSPKVAVDRDQAYFWTQRWQQGEQEAEEDLSAGRHKDFDSLDELLEDMESSS